MPPKTVISTIKRIAKIEKEYNIQSLKTNHDTIKRKQKSNKSSSIPNEYSKQQYLTYRSYLKARLIVKKYEERNKDLDKNNCQITNVRKIFYQIRPPPNNLRTTKKKETGNNNSNRSLSDTSFKDGNPPQNSSFRKKRMMLKQVKDFLNILIEYEYSIFDDIAIVNLYF